MIRFLIISLFIGLFLNSKNVFSEEVFLSKKDFLKIAFSDETPKRKGLRFKGEVKEIAQKIMGSNYKKIRMKYWRQDQKTAWILERIGKVELITAGFIVENCRISSVHVLVYRETHGWEVKYPSFRDQFVGVNMIADYKLDKSTRLSHQQWVDQLKKCDLVFPLIHGPYGEDGTIQTFLEQNMHLNQEYHRKVSSSFDPYLDCFPQNIP